MKKTSVPRAPKSKIKSPAALVRALRPLRASGKGRAHTVVFTNGCFDLLHKGHVSYLDRARRLGKILVVALNADESVRRLKGPDRPLNSLSDRLDVIAGLECVDFVTWFTADTPLQLILQVKPDVLVKGGDWKVSQIVGASEVLSWGGQVRSLPYIEGRSTTALIQRARGG